MSPKAKAAKSKPTASKKSAPAKAATLSKKGPASASSNGKGAKAGKLEAAAVVDPNAPVVDLEELEEQEAEAASARAGSAGGADAALAAAAAAGGPGEISASFKNFRHHPDMENFYRFIFENDLRHEAVAILDKMQAERLARKAILKSKGQAH